MCETFFIDKTESERIAIANELKNEIDKKGGYASSDILENHKYDSIDFAFVDKHNPSIVYSVEVIIPQIEYDDFVSNIAMERTHEKMSEEDNIVEISATVKEMIITRDSIQKVVDKIRKIVDENNIDFRSADDLSKYNWIGEKITEKDIVFDENWIETFQIDMIGELSEFEFEK